MRILSVLILSFVLLQVKGQNEIKDSVPVAGRWSIEKINNWYDKQPWLVGCNYYPATAINQIEMWQASTWDPERIDLELRWAADIGMNTLRVYLHDLVWANDEEGFYQRINAFLDICKNHGIRPWFVFFDDCHHPDPKLGKQPLPVKAYHNSGWANCPARDVAKRYAKGKATEEEKAQLKGYVQNTIKHFKDDDRILMWELYNEPGRGMGKKMMKDQSSQLVYDSWVWAREIHPSQPITSTTAGSVGKRNIKINRINSDLHSIHSYSKADELRELILEYKAYGRPVIVSEWLARDRGCTVENCLPLMKELNVGAINWGFVSGKSGTIWNWGSRRDTNGNLRDLENERKTGNVIKPGGTFPEPKIWFHDLLRFDGTPYDPDEIKVFKKLTGTD
jgi:hypothetical protein